MKEALQNFTMADGSRQFASLPNSCSWKKLYAHLGTLPGIALGKFLTDNITEAWIDFSFEGHEFTINTQFDELWFFVRRSDCPDSRLLKIVDHCSSGVAT